MKWVLFGLRLSCSCCYYVPLFNSFIGLRDFLAFKYNKSCQLKSSARLDTKYVCIFYPILAIQTVKWCYIHTLLKRQGIGNFFLDFPKTTIESDRFFYKKKKEEIGNSLTQDNDNTGVVLKVLQLCCLKRILFYSWLGNFRNIGSGSAARSKNIHEKWRLS